MQPPRRSLWKRCEIQVGCHGCGGRLIAKNLITTIQVNLVPNPSETWGRQHKFTQIVIIKFFVINLPSQPFLGHYLGFLIFIPYSLLGNHTLFTAGLYFELDTMNTLISCANCQACWIISDWKRLLNFSAALFFPFSCAHKLIICM